MPRSAALAMLMVLLAGCAGTSEDLQRRDVDGADPAGASSGPATAAPPRHDEATGAVAGRVVDDEARPVPNATVELEDVARARADASGAFSFSDVAPGQYIVYVNAFLFQSVARAVVVEAGQTQSLDFVLHAISLDTPHRESIPFEGYMRLQFGLTVGHVLSEHVPALECVCEWNWTTQRGLTTMLSEIEYRPTVAQPGKDSIVRELLQSENGVYLSQEDWPSRMPIPVENGKPRPGSQSTSGYVWEPNVTNEFRQRILCQTTFVCSEQRFSVWLTNFYFEPFDPEFSALPPED